MKSIIQKPFGLLLLFIALLGVELFAVYLLTERDLLSNLLIEDRSYVSRVILVIYLLASLHVVVTAYWLSRESSAGMEKESVENKLPGLAGSYVRHYFVLLKEPSAAPGAAGSDESTEILLNALDGRCRGRYRFGYVAADLMLKLGLLGTVVGFIFMLGSLVDLKSVDITVMQKLLGQMSGGMKVALYTTLTGMSCGVLLNLKYQVLDWYVDNLLDDVREHTYRLFKR